MRQGRIHIVGGGIIGLSAAWYLQEAGFTVTVVDRTSLEDGTSYGNAGMIVPSHFVPMASPGVIQKGLQWLLFPDSPFYIKPRLRLDLVKWLWQFYRAATPEHVARSAPLLLAFHSWSKHLYQEFSKLDAFSDIGYEEKGLLLLYKTAKQEREERELAEQAEQLGVEAKILSAEAVQRLEPEMTLDVRGGLYFPADAHLAPSVFMRRMQTALKAKGVDFLSNFELTGFSTDGNMITGIQTSTGRHLPVEQVLIAGGSWSSSLLRQLKVPILLQAGKGYSITLDAPGTSPRIPTILAEAKVAITPMMGQLRIGGTLELGPPERGINARRVRGILDSLPQYYRNLDPTTIKDAPVWQGFRPCTPDGLPYIGRSKRWRNLSLATGHGMMGLSLGPATGKLISQILSDTEPGIEPRLFAPDRFGLF